MTIPIMPGPFSFLAQAGQALGQLGQEKEKARQQLLKEAQDNLNRMIELRTKGLLPPESFSSPEAMKIYKTLGITPASSAPTSTETIEDIRRRSLAPIETPGFNLPLSSVISGARDVQVKPTGENIPISQRIAAGVPLPSQVTGEQLQTGKNQAQLAAVQAGGAAGRAVTGVPSEQVAAAGETTAVAESLAKEDVYQNSLAGRSVDAAMSTLGLKPEQVARLDASGQSAIVDEAWKVISEDAKSKGQVVNERVTRPYIQALVAMRVREAYREVSVRMASASAGRGGDPELAALKVFAAMNSQAIAQLKALPVPDRLVKLGAQNYLIERAKAEAKGPEALAKWEATPDAIQMKMQYDEYDLYDRTQRALLDEAERNRKAQTDILSTGRLPGAAGGGPTPGVGGPEATDPTDAMARDMSTGKLKATALFNMLKDGYLSQEQYDSVIAKYQALGQAKTKP